METSQTMELVPAMLAGIIVGVMAGVTGIIIRKLVGRNSLSGNLPTYVSVILGGLIGFGLSWAFREMHGSITLITICTTMAMVTPWGGKYLIVQDEDETEA
ncbi:MAG: hypothetical protein K1X53_09190 [Candidatus Sumerlaeaceae bacterium]|nr:hypothetical protein [Candidatus Sumerlaeaceae bacterium]